MFVETVQCAVAKRKQFGSRFGSYGGALMGAC